MGEVVWLGRYPVKSMIGEELDEAQMDASGVGGDRRYALIDAGSGLVASAKNPRRWRTLLSLTARYGPGDRVAITGAGDAALHPGDPDTDAVLSRIVGRPVRLASTRPEGAAMERLTPPTEPGAGALTRSVLAAGTPGDTFVDYAAVHVITTATLDALGAHHPGGRVDRRRFRPNVVVETGSGAAFEENGWVGRTVTLGDAEIRIVAPTPRCAVPTLAHGGDLPEDPAVLRTAARLNRIPVFDGGLLTCVGAYGAVQHPGRVRVGDRVTVAA